MHCTYCYCIQLRIVTLSARVLQAVQTLPGTVQLLQLWVLAAFFSPAVSKQLTATAVSGWNAIEIIKKYSKTLFNIFNSIRIEVYGEKAKIARLLKFPVYFYIFITFLRFNCSFLLVDLFRIEVE